MFKPKPPQPSRAVRIIGGTGRTLIASGLLVLGFVAYQLWGTGIQYARAQEDLRRQFSQQVTLPEDPPESVERTTTTAFATTMPGPTQPPLLPTPTAAPPITVPTSIDVSLLNEGDPIAQIEIPRLGVDEIVVAGVSREDLKKGPGHYPETPLPGQRGNAAIAGHRTTYGAPFYDVNELIPGDEIWVTTIFGRFRYVVNAEPRIVEPTDLSVIAPSDEAILTLTSCHPRYSARQRIVITAELDEKISTTPLEPTPYAYDATTAVDQPPDESVVSADPLAEESTEDPVLSTPAQSTSVEELSAGWFSEPEAWPHTIGYALGCTAIAVAAWLASKRINRWAAYALAAPVFCFTLYFFYENVARLLPPNI